MQLNYKHEFAEVLRDGTKIHTIRQNLVPPGAKLTHVIYPYDRERREMVIESTCTGYQFITIKYYKSGAVVFVEGVELSPEQSAELLKNDGLTSATEKVFRRLFREWVSGYIIHWTDKRY